MSFSRAIMRVFAPKSAAILDHYDRQQRLAEWIDLQCENPNSDSQKRLARFLAQPTILDRIDDAAE